MSNDKLAEALRELKTIADSLPALATKVDVVIRLRRAERMAATINKIIQAHAAEAAQAQAQSGEWVQKAIVDAKGDIEYVHVRIFNAMKARAEEAEAMLAAAPQPQPAQDASKYQELLMAVEKKFPGESRHETALRYIRQAELRSCEPKCDSSMAKESGR